jgi:conjugative relaxase-like TrwC/TraI family protein
VGGDERLTAAHDKAARDALGESEKYAATHVRLDGANENRTTANWIVAAYRYDSSRELHPQLYNHAVAANLSYDGAAGRCGLLASMSGARINGGVPERTGA